jgi:cell wall-associated NlpC family hydrolase
MSATAQAAVAEARRHLGTPYVYGGAAPGGFDCSGLVQYCYGRVGVSLPRTTSQQINAGTAVSQGNLQIGDLVFPSSGHVGLYSGNGKFIHAPKTGDVVKEANVYAFYAGRRVA